MTSAMRLLYALLAAAGATELETGACPNGGKPVGPTDVRCPHGNEPLVW